MKSTNMQSFSRPFFPLTYNLVIFNATIHTTRSNIRFHLLQFNNVLRGHTLSLSL